VRMLITHTISNRETHLVDRYHTSGIKVQSIVQLYFTVIVPIMYW
jgi:hypothetical protein